MIVMPDVTTYAIAMDNCHSSHSDLQAKTAKVLIANPLKAVYNILAQEKLQSVKDVDFMNYEEEIVSAITKAFWVLVQLMTILKPFFP